MGRGATDECHMYQQSVVYTGYLHGSATSVDPTLPHCCDHCCTSCTLAARRWTRSRCLMTSSLAPKILRYRSPDVSFIKRECTSNLYAFMVRKLLIFLIQCNSWATCKHVMHKVHPKLDAELLPNLTTSVFCSFRRRKLSLNHDLVEILT